LYHALFAKQPYYPNKNSIFVEAFFTMVLQNILRSMATFKALVLAHQKKDDGTYNVKVRVTHLGKSKYIKTQHYVGANDILKKGNKIKIKNQSIVDLTDELILSYRKKLINAGPNSEGWDVSDVVRYVTEDSNKFQLDFIAYGRLIADRLDAKGKFGTAKQYRIVMNSLTRFLKRECLDISEITSKFMLSYESFIAIEPSLRGKGDGSVKKGGRAISLYPARVRSLHNLAKNEYNDEDLGIIRIPLSPFSKYKVQEIPISKHRTLTIEQIQAIIDLPYKKNRQGNRYGIYNMAKDVFLLSFALMGMNSADLYGANKIDDWVITYQRQKTKTRRQDKAELKVRVEPEIRCLFDKYKDKCGSFVFEFHDRYKFSDTFNKMINMGLKQIGEDIGIDDLQFYYARHSFATIAANKAGIDVYRVDEMLNHSDSTIKLARVYIERDYTLLWDANKKVIDFFDWERIEKDNGSGSII